MEKFLNFNLFFIFKYILLIMLLQFSHFFSAVAKHRLLGHGRVFLNYILLIMLLQFSPFFSLYPPLPCTPKPSSISPLSSCPWVVHISSLSSLFPIPFLTSPHLFYAYQLCFFFLVPFPCYSSLPPPH